LVVHLTAAGEEERTRLPSTAPTHSSRPCARGARGERSEASRMASDRAGLYAFGWNGAGQLGTGDKVGVLSAARSRPRHAHPPARARPEADTRTLHATPRRTT